VPRALLASLYSRQQVRSGSARLVSSCENAHAAGRRNSPGRPSRFAGYQWELALTPAEDKTRWEFLEWQIQRAQRRPATPRAHDDPSPAGRSPSEGCGSAIAEEASPPDHSMPCSGRRSLSLPRDSRQGAGRGLADGGRRTRDTVRFVLVLGEAG
jgi:hypothetical protein